MKADATMFPVAIWKGSMHDETGELARGARKIEKALMQEFKPFKR